MDESSPLAAVPHGRDLLEELRGELARLEDPLEVLATELLGLESRIDLVARDARGQAVVVLVAETGTDLRRFAEAQAQRAWVAPRVADWLKLAPGLGLRPELGVRILLLAPAFDARTRAAAESLGREVVCLATWRRSRDGAWSRLWIDEADAPEPPADDRAPVSVFRTGLRLNDV